MKIIITILLMSLSMVGLGIAEIDENLTVGEDLYLSSVTMIAFPSYYEEAYTLTIEDIEIEFIPNKTKDGFIELIINYKDKPEIVVALEKEL